MINIHIDAAKWTDAVVAIAAIIGVPVTVITLYKLMKKDKEREAEINSLTTIAQQLTDMQTSAENRYEASRKPIITPSLIWYPDTKKIRIDFLNSSPQSTLTDYAVSAALDGYTLTKTTINQFKNKQTFFIGVSYREAQPDHINLQLNYITEEGYTFIQDILIWFEENHYVMSPTAIVNLKRDQAAN